MREGYFIAAVLFEQTDQLRIRAAYSLRLDSGRKGTHSYFYQLITSQYFIIYKVIIAYSEKNIYTISEIPAILARPQKNSLFRERFSYRKVSLGG